MLWGRAVEAPSSPVEQEVADAAGFGVGQLEFFT